MTLYTKTGDDGTTALFGGRRVSKTENQVEAYGTIDELTSFIGVLIVKINDANDQTLLINIQKNLYRLMAVIAGAKEETAFLAQETRDMEKYIDRLEAKLPKLSRFILPGGNELSAWFQVVRAVCRRAERNVVRHSQTLKIIPYLNRLSDLFFVMARHYNREKEITV